MKLLDAADLELVDRIAGRQAARCPRTVTQDELRSAGYRGLLDAAGRWDPARGTRFATYASARILGAMRDWLRDSDWVTRSARARGERAPEVLRLAPGRKRYLLAGTVQDVEDRRRRDNPTEALEWAELLRLLPSPRLRVLVDLRFREERSQREVGEVLGVSESRACQLERRALRRLRELLA